MFVDALYQSSVLIWEVDTPPASTTLLHLFLLLSLFSLFLYIIQFFGKFFSLQQKSTFGNSTTNKSIGLFVVVEEKTKRQFFLFASQIRKERNRNERKGKESCCTVALLDYNDCQRYPRRRHHHHVFNVQNVVFLLLKQVIVIDSFRRRRRRHPISQITSRYVQYSFLFCQCVCVWDV